jgi:VanZ family protein
MKLPAIARRADLWLLLYLSWFAILWNLSSGPVQMETGVEIPHLDKVCHFGYFFGGAGLLSAFLYRLTVRQPNWTTILACVMFLSIAVGMLDEWHQSWVPERSGNDAGDLCADALGGLAGFLVFRRLHHWLDEK